MYISNNIRMAAESNLVMLKRQLAGRIGPHVRHMRLTQSAAADELGVSQPRLNALLKGRVELLACHCHRSRASVASAAITKLSEVASPAIAEL